MSLKAHSGGPPLEVSLGDSHLTPKVAIQNLGVTQNSQS